MEIRKICTLIFIVGFTIPSMTDVYAQVQVRHPEPNLVLRSAVVPGWGQLAAGETAKGTIMMGIWGATATGVVGSHLKYRTALRRYEQESLPSEVIELYDDAQGWKRARTALAIGSIVVWVVSVVDASLGSRTAQIESNSLGLHVTPTGLRYTAHL